MNRTNAVEQPGVLPACARALRRIDAHAKQPPPLFQRRRALLLRLGVTLILAGCLPWGYFFALRGHLAAATLEACLGLLALALLRLLDQGLARLAALLLCGGGALLLAALILLADIPSAAVPRHAHLLLPMAMSSCYLLAHERALWRLGLPSLQLTLFAVLAGSSSSFGRTPLMDDAVRQISAAVISLLTVISLAAVLAVILGEALSRSRPELDFARGIGAGELKLFLQAQCDAQGRIVGAEALMRWQHRERGFVAPGEFMALAEDSGLIMPAGADLTRQVCAALRRWRDDPVLAQLTVTVNVNPMQFRDAAAMRELMDIVSAHGIAAGRLKFELTEALFVKDVDAVCRQMEACRAMGIAISLDDFGTGYSSLAALRRMPLDQLKVDQSFVRELAQDAEVRAIARSIVRLGQELGLEVIAEGVETPLQLAALQELGCERFQGYLFARPLPLDAFEESVAGAARSASARPVQQPA